MPLSGVFIRVITLDWTKLFFFKDAHEVCKLKIPCEISQTIYLVKIEIDFWQILQIKIVLYCQHFRKRIPKKFEVQNSN